MTLVLSHYYMNIIIHILAQALKLFKIVGIFRTVLSTYSYREKVHILIFLF